MIIPHGSIGRISGIIFLLISIFVSGTACGGTESTEHTYKFSFEEDMEGWVPDGTDLDNPPVKWSIHRSNETASDGDSGLKVYLNNVNDAGKIWIERSFDLEPNTTYDVAITYEFASADYGDFNLWTIIAGAAPEAPQNAGDLIFQGDTGTGSEDQGFIWLTKNFDFIVQSADQGFIWVFVGVWGTWETPRTYFIDNVTVGFNAQ